MGTDYNYTLTLCSSLSGLGQKTWKFACDVAVLSLDVNGSGPEELDPLQKMQEQLGQAPIIVTSEKDDSDWIVRLIRAGAYDFIAKPYSGEKIRLAVDSALEKKA